jgi:hypothetical protein
MIGLTAGFQYRLAEDYVQDWESQKNFFWQLNWRVPDLQPGTILMTNPLPFKYYSDNSLAAPLNWLWGTREPSDRLDYMFIFPKTKAVATGLSNLNWKSHTIIWGQFQWEHPNSIAVFYPPVMSADPYAYPETESPAATFDERSCLIFCASTYP